MLKIGFIIMRAPKGSVFADKLGTKRLKKGEDIFMRRRALCEARYPHFQTDKAALQSLTVRVLRAERVSFLGISFARIIIVIPTTGRN